MAKLKPGMVVVDLAAGAVYGDLDHCPMEELLESAAALLDLLPQISHKGLWGLGKDFDVGCYLFTTAKGYRVSKDLALEEEIDRGPTNMPAPISAKAPCISVSHGSRADYWRSNWYSRLIGSITEGQVSEDTEGKPDHYQPPAPRTVQDPAPVARRSSKAARRPAERPVQRGLF